VALIGYLGAVSVLPGESIDLYLSTDGTRGLCPIKIERVAGPESATINLTVSNQPLPSTAAWEGYKWTASPEQFVIPDTWPSGYYEARGDAGELVGGFVVRSIIPGSLSKLLLSVDLITNQAYNATGGKSLYDPGRAEFVSFNRPGGLPDGRELPLLSWLADEGYEIECCAAQDLGTVVALEAYDCLIIAGHAEYWTRAMRDALEDFVSGGGNLVCLSGNTCYRQVRIEDDGRTLVFYKYAGADPFVGLDTTVAFAEPPLNRPQSQFLGVGWTHAAWGAPVAAPYQLRFPGHWAMAGVTQSATQPFMSYETDAAAYVEEPEGYPRATGEEGTTPTFVTLGTADLRDLNWAKPGHATMGIYRKNGTVFAAGTTDWVLALVGEPGFVAGPAVETITKNVLSRLSSRLPLDWERIGHANDGSALTAVESRLFLATTANRLWRRYPVAAEVPWTEIGHANNVVAMASDGAALYAVTQDHRLWRRPPFEVDIDWVEIGTTLTGTRGLACAGGSLYTIDTTGTVLRRPATAAPQAWAAAASLGRTDITTLASANDILYAATSTDRLLRTNRDFISESTSWVDIMHCNFAVGLAIVDGGLFVATRENRLWLLDLHNLRAP
jgi:hypothetical protein